MKSVWIYEIGRDNMKIFATEQAAKDWFAIHDPEGVAFEYPVEGK